MSTIEKGSSTASRQSDADAELAMAAASKAAASALRAGARAPLFTLADASGRRIALEALLSTGPVVLRFFRGAWCSFGEHSVAEFASMHQDVVSLGASAVAIAPPSKPTVPSDPVPMPELQDIGMKVARAYGLAFDLPVGLRPRYEALGYTPPSTKRAGTWLVPIPATYLLDRDGTVALAFIDVDYRKRFEAASLLSALKAVQARHAMLPRGPRSLI
ncbi:peroxiredoxin-like family protein [Burkholderia sp. L27(2015)]|uniref:peroxiredoxin-like family protein n=1 Tax=Burkholderia sp. L27(2015) TaxID=1641858 RepID=UPI00131B099C|nr:peroxiredoxin-like family protein [Burkholderia sp. L27(2015)]